MSVSLSTQYNAPLRKIAFDHNRGYYELHILDQAIQESVIKIIMDKPRSVGWVVDQVKQKHECSQGYISRNILWLAKYGILRIY